jgi:hypothetical protein
LAKVTRKTAKKEVVEGNAEGGVSKAGLMAGQKR